MMLTTIKRSALVMYSAQQMYDLVNDVASYPQYMDGCVASEILHSDDTTMVARLDLKKGAVATSFTTRNSLIAPSQVAMQLEEGPFKTLTGLWEFKTLTESACKVSLDLQFAFNSLSMGIAGNSLFTSVANNLVDALSKRAETIYGVAK